MTGEDRSVVDVLIKHAAPRYMSLALEGYTLLLLDFVHASTIVLNSTDIGPSVSVEMYTSLVLSYYIYSELYNSNIYVIYAEFINFPVPEN